MESGCHKVAVGVIVGGSFAGPNAVEISDSSTGAEVAVETASDAFVGGLSYTSDGRYLIEGHVDGSVRIWNSAHTILLKKMPVDFHNHIILAVSKESHYFAVAEGSRVSVWALK